jgi:glycosyltransferase involved in cell wall biosynthesis
MKLKRSDVLALLRARGDEPRQRGVYGELPEELDTERETRLLERLGVGVGDLLKRYGDRGVVTVREQPRASSRRLSVGLIAPPWVPVPPPVYGGTELVIDQLARGLTAAGHEVVLFATGDATCPVPRRWRYPQALGTVVESIAELAHVEQAYGELGDVNVIHDHTLTGPTWAELPPEGVPVVTTAHGPFNDELRDLYAIAARRSSVVAISQSQRRSAAEIPIAAVIHHGVDVDRYPIGSGAGGYVLFLGRMNADKGAHRAIAAARSAGRKILLAAKMREPAERQFFARQVEPLLGPDAEYLGEVGGQDKLELLAGAAALINPIRWPEPFGLVMIEALACGTPVVAFPEGAVPEIVDHGETGFLCADEADLAARIALVDQIDRHACRAAAETRFSTARMVRDHISLYHRLLAADHASQPALARLPG